MVEGPLLGILPSVADPLGMSAPHLLPKRMRGAATSCMVVLYYVRKHVQSIVTLPHHQ
jgi:uncharacterized membrane protein